MGNVEREADLAILLQPSDLFLPYQHYQPLDRTSKSIRVLEVKLEADDEIHATIIHTKLDDSIEYEALSYCWGPPDVPKTMYIDQEPVSIRSSLYASLLALCQREQPLRVWVDYICIDQRNAQERSWQVSMMGDIYRCATRVKSWIGPSDAYSDYVFAYVNHHREAQVASPHTTPQMKQRALECLQIILDRPYWRRLWVIQEMALARQLWLVCGNKESEWNSFLNTFEDTHFPSTHTILSMKDLRGNVHNPITAPDHIFASSMGPLRARCSFHQALYQYGRNRIRKNETLSNETRSSEPHSDDHTWTETRLVIADTSLLREMLRFSHQACEEARDRIYALLSVASDGEQVLVDYTKSFADVIMDAVEASYETYIEMLHGGTRINRPDTMFWKGAAGVQRFFQFLESAAKCLINVGLEVDCHEYLSAISDTQTRAGILHQLIARDALPGYHKIDILPYTPGNIVKSLRQSTSASEMSPIIIEWKSPENPPTLQTWYDNDGPLTSKNPTDIYRTLVKLGEIQPCCQVYPVSRFGFIECCFFIHYSRLALLALIARNVSRQHSQEMIECLDARRQRYPRPILCTCEVDRQLNREAFPLFEATNHDEEHRFNQKFDIPEDFYK